MRSTHKHALAHGARAQWGKPFGMRSGERLEIGSYRMAKRAALNCRAGYSVGLATTVPTVRFGFFMLSLGVLLLGLSCFLGL